MLKAVIFDVDGTLVDSVDIHAQAWVDAFSDYGHDVGFQDVRAQIGKGGDQLMPVFLSADEIAENGETIEEHRGTASAFWTGARIHVSHSSGVARITGMAIGWIAPTSAFGSVVRNPNRSAVTSPSFRALVRAGCRAAVN